LIEEIIAYGPNTGSNTTDILQKRVNDLVIAKYNEEW
jgi:phospholipid N-methyltransferase